MLNKLSKFYIKLIKKINLMYKIQPKRCFLPLVGIIGVVAVDGVISYTYLPLVFGFSSFILFWNFPKMAIFFSSRPTYYEDLFLKNNEEELTISDEDKQKFKCIFEWCLIVSSSILCGALSCYWLFNAEMRSLNTYFEVIGITGGILKIYYIINYTIGSIIIMCLQKKIKNTLKKVLIIEDELIDISFAIFN